MERIAARAAALGLITGGLAAGAAMVALVTPDHDHAGFALLFLGALALVMSLPAMYARQADAAGWLGLAGHVLLMAGVMFMLTAAGGFLLSPTFHLVESVTAGLLALAAIAGLLLTAIATVRARVYPRWAGYLLLGASAAFCFSFFVSETLPPRLAAATGYALPLLFAAAFVAIGLALWQTDVPVIRSGD